MRLLTSILARTKIAQFIGTNEGQKAFENLQYDVISLWDSPASVDGDFSVPAASTVELPFSATLDGDAVYMIEIHASFTGSPVFSLSLPPGAVASQPTISGTSPLSGRWIVSTAESGLAIIQANGNGSPATLANGLCVATFRRLA